MQDLNSASTGLMVDDVVDATEISGLSRNVRVAQ